MPGLVPPPPGYTYLGRDGESYGPEILIANGITIAFALIVYICRIFVKGFMIRKVHTEDYLVTVAVVFALARFGTQAWLVDRYQFGQHIWDYELVNLDHWHFINKVALLFYFVAIICCKCAVLLFYVRLFGIRRGFRWLCYGLMFVTVVYCGSFMLVTSLSCRPISAGWGTFLEVEGATCLNQIPLAIITGGFNIATDFLIVVLPIPLVAKLQLRISEMLGVMAVLATGFIVVAVAIVRQVMVVNASAAGSDADVTVISAQIDMWLSLELNIGVAGTCLPVLAPLQRKIVPMYSSLVSLLRERRSSRSSETTENSIRKQSRSDGSETEFEPKLNVDVSLLTRAEKGQVSGREKYEH